MWEKIRNPPDLPYDPQPNLMNLQEPANENYRLVMQFGPTLLRLFGLTVAVFTRFHFGRYYITAHTNALLGVLIMTGGMGGIMLMMVFAGFLNQPDSSWPLGVFLLSALLMSMLHRAIAFVRAIRKGPEPGMFPGKPWIGMILPFHARWIYIVIEPGMCFAVGYWLSTLNWPLGLWVMIASSIEAIVGFLDVKNHLFSVLDARDAGVEGEIFTAEVTRAGAPGQAATAANKPAIRRFRVRVNKARALADSRVAL